MTAAPKVSVLITTYNHEAFIAQAVTSALTQRTSFPVEVIVGEDCSTDGTRDILLSLKKAHPDSLTLLLHDRNIGGPLNVAAVLAACRGPYVAMLEGDDYWTHPLKLQKQVDALDANPAWSACFHYARMFFEDGSHPTRLHPESWNKDVVTIDDLFLGNPISTGSLVFRNGLFGPLPSWHREILPGDWAIHFLNAHQGPIGFIPEVLADYRVHSQGLWTSKKPTQQYIEVLRMLSRLDHHFGGRYARQIDEHRINLVGSLAQQLGQMANHAHSLEQQLGSLMQRDALARQTIERLRQRPVRRHSAFYELSRAIMRPLERVGHRLGEAIGVRGRRDLAPGK